MWAKITDDNVIDTDKYKRFWKDEHKFTYNGKRGYMIMADDTQVAFFFEEDGKPLERDKRFNDLVEALGK